MAARTIEDCKGTHSYHFRTPTSCSVGDIRTVICSADSGPSESGITAIESGSWKLFFKKCSGDTIAVAKNPADAEDNQAVEAKNGTETQTLGGVEFQFS